LHILTNLYSVIGWSLISFRSLFLFALMGCRVSEPSYWITAKYEGHCAECGQVIEPGDRMVWDAQLRRAYCKDCGEDESGEADPKE
jgi:hypothetical protein